MKKLDYLLLYFYSLMVVAVICHTIFHFVGFQWGKLLSDISLLQSFLFLVFSLTLALTALVVLIIKITQFVTVHAVQQKVESILTASQRKEIAPKELNQQLDLLDSKLLRLEENLQKSENRVMRNEEEIVRKRIARDLHDTVSQELFAANMILSGVAAQALELEKSQIQQQLNGVSDILGTAQNDLRVLLLHLRPTELEGKSLVEGMEMIFRELKEKSNLTVVFHHNDVSIPKDMEEYFTVFHEICLHPGEQYTLAEEMEEHLFRIVQEIVSNTLKHARAQQMDVFLHQEGKQLHLRMVDDGIGFEQEKLERLSYGLKNIQERVEDMAGTIKIRTSPQKGVAVDIRVPLLVKDKNEKETV